VVALLSRTEEGMVVGVGSRSGGVTRYHRRAVIAPLPPPLSLSRGRKFYGAASSAVVVVKATEQAACLSVGSPSEDD